MDLVVLSEVRWGYYRTRKQFLLSRFPEPWRVFFAQPPGGPDDPWEPRREGRVTCFTVPFLKPGTRNPAFNLAVSQAPGRLLVERIAEAWLRRVLRGLGVEPEPVLLVSNIYAARALSRLRGKLVFYDFNDSPFQFAGAPRWARGYWRRTLAQVDAFFVVSEYYRRELSAQTDRPVVLLGNGVEFARFSAARAIPPALEALPRPRIGYLGLLSHFLDFDLLERLRRARRGGTLVLVGPGDPATRDAVRALAGRDGVAVLGPQPYDDVPAWMQGFDVGVIPFRAAEDHVRGINPNKVYQYLAAGLPVVTTPVLDLEPRQTILQYASGGEEWERALARALDAPRDPEASRALARPHDWDRLAARMVAEIERRVVDQAAVRAVVS
ncbi:MAG TPA: glycosyltransferase [Terriglobales bacterium]|nr:glycosyltransferase [Terriglobales bacterium]